MQQDKSPTHVPKEDEMDLGVFFNLLGRIVSSISKAIQSLFTGLFQFIIFIFIFIKRKMVWLAIGLIAGLGFGLFSYLKDGPSYYSDMTVKTNFENAGALYNVIDYFNSLIKSGKIKEVTTAFNIPEADARRIIRFEVSPLNNELEAVKLYKNFISDYSRINRLNDTQWVNIIKYTDFKKSLTPHNYPLQSVRVYSNNPDIYKNIQSGIFKNLQEVKSNDVAQNKVMKLLREEESIVTRSLNGIDSLRTAYNKSIADGKYFKSDGGGMLMGNYSKIVSNPEIELYDKELLLKDEMTAIKNKIITQESIFNIVTDFNERGTKVSGYRENFVTYAWMGMLITFCLLVLIEFYRYIDKKDKQKKETAI